MRTSLSDSHRGDWQIAKLGDLSVKVTSGGTPKRLTDGYYTDASDENGIPWVKTQELQDVVLHDTQEHITELALRESSAKKLPAGTLLMAMYAAPTAGRMAILGREMACNQAACAFIFDEERVNTRFMFYQLLNARADLHQLANGAAQQNLSARVLKEFEVLVPPLEEQRRIAGVLGALDDLIEVNRGLIRDLEMIGSALIRSHAPGCFSVLAGEEVPGYEMKTVGEVCGTIETGSRPKGGVGKYLSGVPSLGAESVNGLAKFNFAQVKYVPVEFADNMRRGKVESHDVLVYKDGGTPGNFIPKVGMLGDGFPFESFVINEHVFRVRGSEEVSQEFLYFWFATDELLSELARAGTGAAIPGMNSTNFKAVPLVVPPESVRESLYPVLKECVTASLALAAESRQLECTRDELLPLLLSGRVRVGDIAA